MYSQNMISVDVFGDFACFTRPENKVERVSYNVPTPSACRGILNAIYSKPSEFYYEIKQIEIMNPIRTINIKKNEVNTKATLKKLKNGGIFVGDAITQRNTVYLRNVYYRIYAQITKHPECETRVTEQALVDQFNRRVQYGKCFWQPYLGMRECVCFFHPIDPDKHPIRESMDLGIMLYDNFDICSNIPLDTDPKTGSGEVFRSFYHPYMINGVIAVPNFKSHEVWKEDE